MKAIFLDIDGVLNNFNTNKKYRSKSRCRGLIGIDKDKTKRLAKIVQETNSILILTSSWKIGWEPKLNEINTLNYHAKYLNNHLRRKGKLFITDKTREYNLNYRGMGIKEYLIRHPEITEWIVLDDEIFPDYEYYKILPHLIQTDSQFGLTDAEATAAIMMLKGKITGPYKASTLYYNHYNKIENKNAGPTNGTEK